MGVSDMVVEQVFKIVNWESRLRILGYAPVVICLIREPVQHRFLLTAPVAHAAIWAPPQRMMQVKERPEDTASRCLEKELGLNLNQTKFVRSAWIGKRLLPKARDQRDLPQSLRGWLKKDNKRMIGKGYYAALIHVREEEPIQVNKAEINAYKWVSAEVFKQDLQTNDPDKLAILLQVWDKLLGDAA